MHIAAMKPTVLSYTELDEQFVKDELAQINHKIEQDNESVQWLTNQHCHC